MLKKVIISQQRLEDKYFEPGIELEIDESSFGSLFEALSVMQRCTPEGYTLRIDISDYNNKEEEENG